MRPEINISDEDYQRLSDRMLQITREFNVMENWNTFTTGGWRSMTNEALDNLLIEFIKMRKIKVDEGDK